MVGRRMYDYLQLVQDTLQFLKNHPDPILSTSEDCDYFRQKFKESSQKKKSQPKIEIEIKIPPTTPVFVQPKAMPLSPPPASPILQQEPPPLPPKTIAPKIEVPLEDTRTQIPLNSYLTGPGIGKWKTLFAKIAPELPLIAEIPNDAIAQKIATRWKTKNLSAPITLLSNQEIPEQKALLEQIRIALEVHFAPSKLVIAEPIETSQQWETFLCVPELKLVIVCDYTLWQMPNLLKFYKESPTRRIGEKDLFLLPDLSLYLKDPLLKRSLWKALCQYEPLLSLSSSTKI